MSAASDARQRGQATVELVVALPVVVLSLLLVIQVALVARDQVTVVHTAREGARAGAVAGTRDAAIAAAVQSAGLRAGRLSVDASVDPVAGGRSRVRVRYRVPTDVPLVGALLGDREVAAEVVMRVEGPPEDG